MRRLTFVNRRIEALLGRTQRSDELSRTVLGEEALAREKEWLPDFESVLRDVKRTTNGALILLRMVRGQLRSRRRGIFSQLDFPVTRAELQWILEGAMTRDESVAKARQLLADPERDERLRNKEVCSKHR